MSKGTIAYFTVLALVLWGITLGVLLGRNPAGAGTTGTGPEMEKALANELVNKELYPQAIDHYRTYLATAELDPPRRANIHYMVGKLYQERMKDFPNALAAYVAAKTVDPQTNLEKELNKRMVECLEQMHRSLDAQNVLSEATRLKGTEPTPKAQKGAVVAEIGDRKITVGDIDAEINSLPPYYQKQFDTPEKKQQFFQQYLLTELLYNTAQRKGYGDDPVVAEKVLQFKKQVMADRVRQEEISGKVNLSDDDLKLYYDAHKNEFTKPGEKETDSPVPLTFEEAKEQVQARYGQEKEQKAAQELFERLMKAENVKVYQDALK